MFFLVLRSSNSILPIDKNLLNKIYVNSPWLKADTEFVCQSKDEAECMLANMDKIKLSGNQKSEYLQ